MTRRSAGFVTKRAHTKSRGGCRTCKQKKVKCDQGQPTCGYCTLRKLECVYTRVQPASPQYPTPDSSASSIHTQDYADFNSMALQIPAQLVPTPVDTSSGQLTATDLYYLHVYRTLAWRTITMVNEQTITKLYTDWIPLEALSKDYLLNTILSMSAALSNILRPASRREKNQALVYRQKALQSYQRALQDITVDNFESLLVTSLFMVGMSAPPRAPCDDNTMLNWIFAFFSLMQGTSFLAGLKWMSGIEKLTVFPIFRRELRPLPPLPVVDAPLYTIEGGMGGEIGTTPEYPNPPKLYEDASLRPQRCMATRAFLPPSLLRLLKTVADPPETTGRIDVHRNTLIPAIHILSPIFLSLYYFHLGPDMYVRVHVFPTHISRDFFDLIKRREPRALVIIAWWFTLSELLPKMWWLDEIAPRVLQTISNEVMRSNDKISMDVMVDAFKLVKMVRTKGKEAGARSIFDAWPGVNWEDGPGWEKQSRFEEEARVSAES